MDRTEILVYPDIVYMCIDISQFNMSPYVYLLSTYYISILIDYYLHVFNYKYEKRENAIKSIS